MKVNSSCFINSLFLLLTLVSCSRIDITWNLNKMPEVETDTIEIINCFSARCSVSIIDDGGSVVFDRGICYSLHPAPTLNDSVIKCGSGIGTFITEITGLTPLTLYYLKAYAINKQGTGYGEEISFTTPAETRECEKLEITIGKYSETGNLLGKIQAELGTIYTLGDWTNLKAIKDIPAWISCMDLKEDQQFIVTYYGYHFYGSSRHYFVQYSNGNPSASFLVHDQINNRLFLGSWYGLNMNILVKKN